MFVVHISMQVKPEYVEEFKQACIENSRNSIKESLISRFDVLQQSDDPTRFVLVEAYLDETGTANHKRTDHYNKWRETAEKMLVGERTRVRYVPIWPEEY